MVIQDLFTKWPMVFPVPDQKAVRIGKLIAEEVVPLFGVPEGLLSDRGTNLLSHLILDLCGMLGITKLNTTAHHRQCDRTLKTMFRKHAARFGNQWVKSSGLHLRPLPVATTHSGHVLANLSPSANIVSHHQHILRVS